MKMANTLKMLGSAATFLAAFSGAARAQTNYTWMGTASGSWSNSANWDIAPVSGQNNLLFGGTPTYTDVVQDTGSAFSFNRLQFQSSAANGYALSGGALQIGGANNAANGNITVSNPASGQGVLIANAVSFTPQYSGSPASYTINIQNDLTGPNDALYFGLVLSGSLSGGGTVTKLSSSVTTQKAALAITSSNNTFAGTFVNQTGITDLVGNNALGMNSVLNTGTNSTNNAVVFGTQALSTNGNPASGKESTFGVTGSFQEIGSLVGGGTVQFGSAGVPGYGYAGFSNLNDTLYGLLVAVNSGSHFAKVGTGTLSLTNTSTAFLGSLSVRGGTLSLSGSGAVGGSINNVGSTSPFTVYGGATLLLDNNTSGNLASNDRITDTIPIYLNGGTFSMSGDGGDSATSTETVGPLSARAGQSTVTLYSGGAKAGAALTFASGSSSNGGTVFFTGASGDVQLGTSAAKPGGTNVIFTSNSSLTIGGGGATGTPTVSIIPWAFGSTTNGTIDSFVGYFTNGVRALAATEYSSAFSSTGTGPMYNVKLAADSSPAQATTANSLVLATGLTNLTLVGNLTLTSGALLSSSTGSPTIGGAGSLLFGSGGNQTAYVTNTGALTITAPIQAANFSKSGGGTLTLGTSVLGTVVPVQLSSVNAYVAVNAGTLFIGATSGFSPPNGGTLTYEVGNSATLNLGAAPLAHITNLMLNANQTIQGNGTVIGTVTVNSGGTVSPSALGGPDATLASPGTLNVGTLVLSAGSTYAWTANSVNPSAYTSSELTGTSLTLPATGAVTLKITSLSPSNAAGAIQDFNPAQPAAWTIAHFTNAITGFTGANITLDKSAFANTFTGTFSVSNPGGTDLLLSYTAPVPEPASVLLLGAAALGGAVGRRRLRAK